MDLENNKKKYWYGNSNKIIRYYYYSQRGIQLFNEFRYIIMVIFGVYFTLKLSNPIYLVLMFCMAIPILCFAGWLMVHKIARVMDWLNIEFATHFSRYNITLLEEINKSLKCLVKRK